jgi:ligand-binding sensor domain-containing protein
MARHTGAALRIACAALACLAAAVGSRAAAQSVRFDALVNARECLSLVEVSGRLYGGLSDGGVVIWNAADPASYQRWTVADGLSGLRVTSLAWSGQNLWVGTQGAGLTRVTLGQTGPQFRQYANIGGLDVTAVTGFVRGSGEIVYYGLQAGGVGIINSGLPGIVYTSSGHGLVDDNVRSLAVHRGSLWVGTLAGASRFAGNVFTTESAGLPSLGVTTLCASGDTLLLAGTAAGVARWDSTGAVWRPLGLLGGGALSLAVQGGAVWALRNDAVPTLWRWDGAAWSQVAAPLAGTRALAAGNGPAAPLWAAGGFSDPEMDPRSGHAFVARQEDGGWSSWQTDEMIFVAVDGCAFAPDGSVWVGSRQGLGIGRRDADRRWTQVYQLATAANDSTGLFRHGPGVLSMLTLPNGEVWFPQFTSGVVRLRPGDPATTADDQFDLLTAANSGLPDNRILRIIRHPDGPLLFLSDDAGVSVLLDPAHWRNPAQWVRLSTGPNELGGSTVRSAVVARRDQIWFGVEGVGLVRWDLNGSAGADAPLVWTGTGDAYWSPALTAIANTLFDFSHTVTLAAGADGSVWAGGSGGVVHFQPGAGVPTLLGWYREKSDVFVDGLLTASVHDIVLDRGGDLWVGTDAGLNRIRLRDDGTHIDAYTDLASFYSYDFGLLYLPGIISGIPGGQVWELAADPPASRILVGSDNGAALIEIGPREVGEATDLAGLYLYPNPFQPGGAENAKLKLGGITATVSSDQLSGGASVRVYTLNGQLVYSDDHVASDSGFWDGSNVSEQPVASGLYLVRVALGGRHAVRTLAVIR